MMTTGNGGFTAAERRLCQHMWRSDGSFKSKLFEAIFHADDGNRKKLALGFPDEVAVVVAWREGDLASRLRAAGMMD
jgi:hypothetical protein